MEVACEIVRNMIVMYREAEARAAVERLIECGAEELINNEAFLAIKSHLEAMEIFNKWNKLEQTRLSYKAALSIDPSLSFVKVKILSYFWKWFYRKTFFSKKIFLKLSRCVFLVFMY